MIGLVRLDRNRIDTVLCVMIHLHLLTSSEQADPKLGLKTSAPQDEDYKICNRGCPAVKLQLLLLGGFRPKQKRSKLDFQTHLEESRAKNSTRVSKEYTDAGFHLMICFFLHVRSS